MVGHHKHPVADLVASLRRKSPVRVFVLGAVAMAATLVPTATADASGPYYYLAASSSEVDFVQLAITNGNVVGILYEDTVTGAAPSLSLQSQNVNFNGTDDAGQLTLYFGGSSSPIFGSISPKALSLQIPQNDGSLANETLVASSVASYNQLLAAWHKQIAAENAAAAAAQKKQAQATAHKQQLIDNLNAAIQQVENDLSALTDTDMLDNDENVLDNDVNVVNNDLNVVDNDNQVFSNDVQADENPCGDIMNAYGDAHSAYADGESIRSDAKSGVGGDLRAEEGVMKQVPADWAAYWRAQHALPNYQPTNPIPPLKVALATGQGFINGAVRYVNGDIGQANGYIGQAYKIVNNANGAHHCGPLQKAPVVGSVTAQWLTAA